jgi:hypothetical protein
LDIFSTSVLPHEANPPLVIDSDAVLTPPITLECLQAVAGRDPQLVELDSATDLAQFAQRDPLDPWIDRPNALPVPEPFRLTVPE